MVYVVVGIALLCLTVKGYCGKKLSCLVCDTGDAYLFIFLRMLFCSFIGLALVFWEQAQPFLLVEGKMLAICVLSGFSNTAFLVGWILAIRKNSMVSVDVSLTLGSLIPSVLCLLLFAESLSLSKMIGFALIVLATVILAGHSKKTVKGGLMGMLLLAFATVGDGMSGFAQQLYKQYYTNAGGLTHGVYYPKTIYHFYTYVCAALILLLILTVYRIRKSKNTIETTVKTNKNPFAISPRILLNIFITAICLFASNYFQTVAANDYGMPSQVLYPVIKGGCLITVNITAMLFFGEKITLRSALGSVVALLGMISMSIL